MNPIFYFFAYGIQVTSGRAFGDEGPRQLVNYEFFRFDQLVDSPLLALGMVLVTLTLFGFTIGSYRRERKRLSPLGSTVLCLLRLLALSGVVLFFLNLQKRTDQQISTQSQVAILVDTSQSMSVRDVSQLSTGETITRSESITNSLVESSWIHTLRQEHEVILTAFDRDSRQLVQWNRLISSSNSTAANEPLSPLNSPSETGPSNHPTLEDAKSLSGSSPTADSSQPVSRSTWTDELVPMGAETRLGDALDQVLRRSTRDSLAGVIVLSDGGQNSGLDPMAVCDYSSRETSRPVPLFTVGVGSTQPRRNLRVQKLIAPSRLYPNDKATLRGLIQADGYAGRSVNVELFMDSIADNQTGPTAALPEGQPGSSITQGERVGSRKLTFSSDSELLPVEFEIEPEKIGRLKLTLRALVPTDDQFTDDNERHTEVEVVDSQLHVLLLASGATRDYRFLRNQLRRDSHAQVDVCLQQAPEGLSQDANQILPHFPTSKESLYPYDCIVAFDPDWSQLDAQQVNLLEKWVSEEAGGLIVNAGPIHTSNWSQSPEFAKIRALYPVQFQQRLTLLDDGQFGSRVPWPIAFTRAGLEAPYLWLGDTGQASQEVWTRFPGVYGCYAVKGPKPGALVLGHYSDPDAGLTTTPPIYMAEHFYGAGRVFYLGSGELWRLRKLDPGYFEMLTTQLLRHVSQGRILRGNPRGSLLVERELFTVGDTVVLRAQLTTSSQEPLLATNVTCHTISPGGVGRNLKMVPTPGVAGSYMGQFTVLEQGTYVIELPMASFGSISESADPTDSMQLVRRIEVTRPNLEFEQTRRNQQLLAALATRTEGRYYTSLTAAIDGTTDLLPVAGLIESRSELKTIRGLADPHFTERLNRYLLFLICGALCLEWFLRRLLKLA